VGAGGEGIGGEVGRPPGRRWRGKELVDTWRGKELVDTWRGREISWAPVERVDAAGRSGHDRRGKGTDDGWTTGATMNTNDEHH
jgi:hypothetical protein